jgi:pyruvate/2-oxoglutarate dehydrogenase complex dihydrolipoamide dehydrogenase (E3) component
MQRDESSPQEMRQERIYRALMQNLHPLAWRNPPPVDMYNLVVLGTGPAGLAAASSAAAMGAKVAIVERNVLGGNSLNVGSVPSKTIYRTSRLYADMRDAENFGGQVPDNIRIDFASAMERMRRIRTRLSRYESVERMSSAGIDVFFGEGRFTGPRAITIDGKALRFKKALIATGSRPVTPMIPGLAETGYLTDKNVFDLNECPRRLMVVGGGPLGCEGAQAFCRLGARVVIAQNNPTFLPGEERDAAQILCDALIRDGIEVHLNTKVVGVRLDGGQKLVDLVCVDLKKTIAVDAILVGVGRAPNVEGMDLEAAGVDYDTAAGVRVNDFLQTTNPNVYAAGDVCLEQKFTHTAAASARIAAQNALFLGRKRYSALTIPWCTYTDPEIAHVGLYARQACERHIPVETFTILMHDVDRAIADGEEEGFVKIHLRGGTDRILGATIVARHAGEMINALSLAINAKIGLHAMAQVIYAYPTQAEAIKMAADAYNRTRRKSILKFLSSRWLNW